MENSVTRFKLRKRTMRYFLAAFEFALLLCFVFAVDKVDGGYFVPRWMLLALIGYQVCALFKGGIKIKYTKHGDEAVVEENNSEVK